MPECHSPNPTKLRQYLINRRFVADGPAQTRVAVGPVRQRRERSATGP